MNGYNAEMPVPIQVYLDEHEHARLAKWSAQRGWTKSDAIRAAIRAFINSSNPDVDPLIAASGMIRGLPPDFSENFDRYLNETYIAKKTRKRKPKRRKPRIRR